MFHCLPPLRISPMPLQLRWDLDCPMLIIFEAQVRLAGFDVFVFILSISAIVNHSDDMMRR
ncbi:hypothetical protein CCHOA_10570 [Corynebacterium choanae]|uniref:Uncharacterized protein n=1 Tax=Corynebacterium choanae TaxID=1862358 RepID=A0A3G6J9Q6_9CORY|nr:hypothetical protein CCHOA_10570 [Corynebacterium choanae]